MLPVPTMVVAPTHVQRLYQPHPALPAWERGGSPALPLQWDPEEKKRLQRSQKLSQMTRMRSCAFPCLREGLQLLWE